MFFRIGSLVLSPQVVMFPLGALFFLVVARKRLMRSGIYARRDVSGVLLSAAAVASAGLLLFGNHRDPASVVGGQSSFVGYWGALVGVAVWLLPAGKPALAGASAVASGVMVGGAVARLGCVFAGCCRGLPPVFHLWPLYDIAALLGVFAVGALLDKKRRYATLFAFLIGYGALRFLLEFARLAPDSALGLTAGQWFAAIHVAAGVALLLACRAESAALKEKSEARSQESE